ncbi:Transmembrane 9 superfamily member 9 [Bienertia sinuspersici]
MVKVDKLTSADAQLPYAYYSVPFCDPNPMITSVGYFDEVLVNRLRDSPYMFKMWEPLTCRVVCRRILDVQSVKSFQEKILEHYQVNMVLDGLPVAVRHQIQPEEAANDHQIGCHMGLMGHYAGVSVSWHVGMSSSFVSAWHLMVGCYNESEFSLFAVYFYMQTEDFKYYIYNHLVFTVKYYKDAVTDSAKIVGFEVKPFRCHDAHPFGSSVKHEYEGNWNERTTLKTCRTQSEEIYVSYNPQIVQDNEEIVFTYDVIFQESNITWESRWNTYRQVQADEMHYYVASNYLVTLFSVVGVVFILMMRTYRDISEYNESDMLEETGWKLVHADVFRRPSNSDLLCIFVGTGVQCFGTMITAIFIFSVLGFILPSEWNEVWRLILFLWAFMGIFSGYSSARLYNMFDGTQWRKIAAKTAFMLPGPVAIILFILNWLTYSQKSTSAFPSEAMLALIILWFGISVPLVFIGSYFGFRTQSLKASLTANKIPRQIPVPQFYKHPIISIVLGGILPFGTIFYELVEILATIWFHHFYRIQSFQFFAFITLLAMCAGTTIVLCYFQLCREDYRWWWNSYLTSGISGVYLFLYAAYFFADRLYITKPVSILLYFGYMFIGSSAFFVLTGAIGFYACFWFTRLIYSSLKID